MREQRPWTEVLVIWPTQILVPLVDVDTVKDSVIMRETAQASRWLTGATGLVSAPQQDLVEAVTSPHRQSWSRYLKSRRSGEPHLVGRASLGISTGQCRLYDSNLRGVALTVGPTSRAANLPLYIKRSAGHASANHVRAACMVFTR